MNKKLSLVLVVFFIALSSDIVYSQVENTIVDTNSVWSIYNRLVIPNPPPPTSSFLHLSGDTIIDSKHYTKIWENNDLYLTDSMRFCGFIREENKKTFYRGNNEYLLYDFSLSIGDSIAFDDHWFSAIIIDSMDINGHKYKQMKLSDKYDTITLIEKIGSIEGGLFYPLTLNYTGSFDHLLCYFNNNNCLYTNPNFNYCSLSLLDKPVEGDRAIIYPNPVKNYLNIESKQIISKLEVLNIESRVLKSEDSINTLKYRFNLSFLNSGNYILKITYKNKQVGFLKFLKQ